MTRAASRPRHPWNRRGTADSPSRPSTAPATRPLLDGDRPRTGSNGTPGERPRRGWPPAGIGPVDAVGQAPPQPPPVTLIRVRGASRPRFSISVAGRPVRGSAAATGAGIHGRQRRMPDEASPVKTQEAGPLEQRSTVIPSHRSPWLDPGRSHGRNRGRAQLRASAALCLSGRAGTSCRWGGPRGSASRHRRARPAGPARPAATPARGSGRSCSRRGT
jgi:hypothetical protein